jgi:NDP-sugar pyrophosphorylase family protein
LQAVILAGGLGTRLRPLTHQVPKPMVMVANRPFLEHQIRLLKEQGFLEILLLVGYLSEQIQEFFGDGSWHGVHISYSKEEAPLGTGGALRLAHSQLQDEFMLLNGDTYLPMNFADAIDSFRTWQPSGLLVVHRGGQPAKANLAVAVDMHVTESRKEAPGLTHTNAGVGIFKRTILDMIPPACSFSLENELLPQLIARKALRAYCTEVRYYDMGTPGGLESLEVFLSSRAAPC